MRRSDYQRRYWNYKHRPTSVGEILAMVRLCDKNDAGNAGEGGFADDVSRLPTALLLSLQNFRGEMRVEK